MQALRADVAIHAHAVLLLDRRTPRFRKANQERFVLIVGRDGVFGTGAMTRFAHALFGVVPRVQPEHLGVCRVREMFALDCVAGEAGFFADIGCVCHWIHRLRRQIYRYQHRHEKCGDQADDRPRALLWN